MAEWFCGIRRFKPRRQKQVVFCESKMRLCPRVGNMALVGKFAVEARLHIARNALDSSKITSSILEEVSVSAVAMMVSEPPLDVSRRSEEALRALERIGIRPPPERILPEPERRCCGTCEPSYGVEHYHHHVRIPPTPKRLAFSEARVRLFSHAGRPARRKSRQSLRRSRFEPYP